MPGIDPNEIRRALAQPFPNPTLDDIDEDGEEDGDPLAVDLGSATRCVRCGGRVWGWGAAPEGWTVDRQAELDVCYGCAQAARSS